MLQTAPVVSGRLIMGQITYSTHVALLVLPVLLNTDYQSVMAETRATTGATARMGLLCCLPIVMMEYTLLHSILL